MILCSDEVTGRPTNALRDSWRYSTLYYTACHSSDKFLRFPLYEILDSCQCRTSVMNSSARHPLSNSSPIPSSYHQLYHQTRQPKRQLWPTRLARAFSPPLAPRPAAVTPQPKGTTMTTYTHHPNTSFPHHHLPHLRNDRTSSPRRTHLLERSDKPGRRDQCDCRTAARAAG
jgi:hypothetical protein